MALDTMLGFGMFVLGAAIASFIVIYAMRKRGKLEEESEDEDQPEIKSRGLPFKIAKTVPRDEAGRAKDELRLLDLEREILSSAIRRLYEAHAEGKITEEEREEIAEVYKSRIRRVKESISKDESLVALHEMEAMQEDLMKLFSDRFDELTGKIEELRSKVEVTPIKEIAIPITKKATSSKEPVKKRRRRKKREQEEPSPKTEAEKRIEKIRAEVEKVLDKLGQMEVET